MVLDVSPVIRRRKAFGQSLARRLLILALHERQEFDHE
jgi:hypothetical protein